MGYFFALFCDQDEADSTTEAHCDLCFQIWRKPMLTACRHVFCERCIWTWTAIHPSCPTCRFDMREPIDCTVLPRAKRPVNLRNLHMFCANRHLGCMVISTYRGFEGHHRTCPLRQQILATLDNDTSRYDQIPEKDA